MGCPFASCPDFRCRIALRLKALSRFLNLCGEDFSSCPIYRFRLEKSMNGARWPLRFAC